MAVKQSPSKTPGSLTLCEHNKPTALLPELPIHPHLHLQNDNAPAVNNCIYEQIASPIPLAEIVESSSLPTRLMFCDSIYGTSTGEDFLDGSYIDAHFLKETVIANVTLHSGRMLKIPVNAKFQLSCSHLHDPQSKLQSTSRLFKANSLPQIVTIQKGHERTRKSSGFREGEILILQKLANPNTIECFSVTTDSNKTIHKSMKLQFCINPPGIKLCFADVIEHLRLPLLAKLDPSEKKLEQYFSMPCTIVSLSKEQSLIASYSKSTSEMSLEEFVQGRNALEILTAVPMNFQLVELSQKEMETLKKKTKALYTAFPPLCVKNVVQDAEAIYKKLEHTVYRMSESGESWRKGVKLILPSAIASMDEEQPLYDYVALPTQPEKVMKAEEPCSQVHEYQIIDDYLLLKPARTKSQTRLKNEGTSLHNIKYTMHNNYSFWYNLS